MSLGKGNERQADKQRGQDAEAERKQRDSQEQEDPLSFEPLVQSSGTPSVAPSVTPSVNHTKSSDASSLCLKSSSAPLPCAVHNTTTTNIINKNTPNHDRDHDRAFHPITEDRPLQETDEYTGTSTMNSTNELQKGGQTTTVMMKKTKTVTEQKEQEKNQQGKLASSIDSRSPPPSPPRRRRTSGPRRPAMPQRARRAASPPRRVHTSLSSTSSCRPCSKSSSPDNAVSKSPWGLAGETQSQGEGQAQAQKQAQGPGQGPGQVLHFIALHCVNTCRLIRFFDIAAKHYVSRKRARKIFVHRSAPSSVVRTPASSQITVDVFVAYTNLIFIAYTIDDCSSLKYVFVCVCVRLCV